LNVNIETGEVGPRWFSVDNTIKNALYCGNILFLGFTSCLNENIGLGDETETLGRLFGRHTKSLRQSGCWRLGGASKRISPQRFGKWNAAPISTGIFDTCAFHCRLFANAFRTPQIRPHSRIHDLTVKQFYCELAKLGGFLGRTGDGDPGWITIWRGWEKLNALVRGAQLAETKTRCG
jgi:hypothetical protein